MTSLRIAMPPSRPSLLIPSPLPSPDLMPRGGGILLNKHDDEGMSPATNHTHSFSYSTSTTRRESDPPSPSLSLEKVAVGMNEAGENAGTAMDGRVSPTTPLGTTESPTTSTGGQHPPRIRFAPLPDPRRPRSLSTGRNITFASPGGTGPLSATGHREFSFEVRDVGPTVSGGGYDDDDDEVDDDDDEEDSRRRSWVSVGMGSWKGTKKLLTGKPLRDKDEPTAEFGVPLKKSISTGGLMGSSPFRWASEIERKKSMQGSSPGSSLGIPIKRSPLIPTHHRRGSSSENANFGNSLGTSAGTSLGSSPNPVRMLNGRVYGARRASEAAQEEKARRERMEPTFVEWGSGGAANSPSLGSNRSAKKDDDEDDGGGMAWVRRRREERQRQREQAERDAMTTETPVTMASLPAAQALNEEVAPDDVTPVHSQAARSESLSSSPSSTTSSARPGGIVSPITPKYPMVELPCTPPVIRVSEHQTPTKPMAPPLALDPSVLVADVIGEHDSDRHVVQAIEIQPANLQAAHTHDDMHHDVFEDDEDEEAESEDEDEEDDEEDDGDFEDDEEEEIEGVRSTASAAGVEKMSRHKTA